MAFQESQNDWLQKLSLLYAKLTKIDPSTSQSEYANTERDIFYANENASFAYTQSLIARYKDQIHQMKLAVGRGNSISLLHEIEDQIQVLQKQIKRLDSVQKSRINVLKKHINYLSPRIKDDTDLQSYIEKLSGMQMQYQRSDVMLIQLDKSIIQLRVTLDAAMQSELSSRQGLPSINVKMLLDLGNELLLVPALAFKVITSLASQTISAIKATGLLKWSLFAIAESFIILMFILARRFLAALQRKPSAWRDKIHYRWLMLQCLRQNIAEIFIVGNITGLLYFLNVPVMNFMIILYLALVWICFSSIMLVSRLCLIEATHDTTGNDVKLYRRLKWIILASGVVTALTVFVHQLPLLFEVKLLCDRLFLFCLMIVSVFLLRSWYVVPQLILSHIDARNHYLERSVKMLGVLIPVLLLSNSIIGLIGYVNLVMTVSWYEGIFLVVLIGYLLLRALLSDGMEHLSKIVIQYSSNGWLLTEAFLKPIYKVLRLALLVIAGGALFLLYGWDKQSPIVEQMTSLLHYQIASILGTTLTPLSMIELFIAVSVFYWIAKWTREFVYRLLSSRTKDMGVRNSIAILSQYSVIAIAIFISMKLLGIDMRALIAVASLFALGVGMGLRDLVNNFACGFLILLERPLRVGDIVNINGYEGEVTHIGSRAVTVKNWDNMETLVPNTEIFNKTFTNWTSCDNIVRSTTHIKISRHDNPHQVKSIIQNTVAKYSDVLKQPSPEVYLKEMSDTLMEFELRYHVNIRQVKSRMSVMSEVLMGIWDEFTLHGIKPPHPQQEIFIRRGEVIPLQETRV